DLGGEQITDQVVGRMDPALVDYGGEVVTQGGRRGDPPVPVRGDTGDGDGPPLEGREVLPRESEDLGDDLDGEVERQLLDQVGRASTGEPVDELIDRLLDELALPALEHFGAECG